VGGSKQIGESRGRRFVHEKEKKVDGLPFAVKSTFGKRVTELDGAKKRSVLES